MKLKKTVNGTLYVAPGNRFCRIYAIPYRMKAGQAPADILPEYQKDWVEVGRLDQNLSLVFLCSEFQDQSGELEGQMGGTYMAASWSTEHVA